MAGGAREPGRTALSRALAILEVFEDTPRALSQTELVERTGLAQSTVHRLAGELVEWGALSRDAQGRYQVGMRLWELSQNAGRQLREAARPFVQDLHDLTGQTAQIAVRDGAEVLYIDRAYGSARVPRASRVGGRLPLHATAVGRVILAFDEPWVAESLLAHRLPALTPRTETDPARLRRELELIRERGAAVTRDQVRAGACSIAVPVFSRTGEIGAGLGLVLAPTADPERHLAALRGTARRIEQATAHLPLSTILRRTSPIGRR